MALSSRIPLLSKEEALKRGQEQGIDDYIAQLNLFRVLLHAPEIARELNKTIITLVSSDQNTQPSPTRNYYYACGLGLTIRIRMDTALASVINIRYVT